MYLQHFKRMPLKLFDVTLRDGLQSITKMYSLIEKKDMLCDIINTHKPVAIEIGSIVGAKELFSDVPIKNSIIACPGAILIPLDRSRLTSLLKGPKALSKFFKSYLLTA